MTIDDKKDLEYVDYMQRENMDSISEFILMAATLIEIKSKMLLPKEVDENNKEIDPREELVNRLIEYKKFKTLAKDLLQSKNWLLITTLKVEIRQ